MVCQRRGFVEGEIRELDPVADVERRARRVLDEISLRGDSDQDEGQPV